MVLQYAEGRNFDYWIYNNYKCFNWSNKLKVLIDIVSGLKEIHQKQMVHHDFHVGNILFNKIFVISSNVNIYISDMGLCREVGNIDKENIYGVMPYVAPEVLRRRPYTQAADIYSFGMIMYFVATGQQPFANRAHDKLLALDICEGIRPEINVPEAPKCYIDLMKKCWDTDPINRPDATEVEVSIRLLYNSYIDHNSTNKDYEVEKQFKEAETYRRTNLSFFKHSQLATHPQAIYTSRLLNPFTKDLEKYDKSECFDCEITD
jgi:serine/threonine protein kinase